MPYLGDYTDVTIDRCVQLARAAGYKYAGVQYSRQCFGGNDISSFTLPGTCNMTCMGDPRQNCGGICSNAIYVTDPGASY